MNISFSTSSSSSSGGTGSKIGASIFLLIFGAGGLFFIVMMVREIGTGWKMSHWPTVPCAILSSSVSTADKGYAFTVQYVYDFNGHTYTGKTYQPKYAGSDKYDDAQKLASTYSAGSRSACHVNPTNPSEATLTVQSGWMWLAFMPIPLIFVAFGFGGLWFIWFKISAKNPMSDAGKPISDGAKKISGANAGALVFGIFFLVGTAISIFWAIPAIHRTVASRSWPATPCTVISSRVQSHSSDDGTTYSVDILYSYKVNGHEYRSNRYDFIGGSSSGYDGKKKIVTQYAPKKSATCYVDPNDPNYAVLHAGFSWMILLTMIPIVFMLVGGGGLYVLYRGGRKKKSAENIWTLKRDFSSPSPTAVSSTHAPQRARQYSPKTPAELKPSQSARSKFLGLLIFTAVWDGGIAIFLSIWVNNGAKFDFCGAAFATPFMLIGIGLLVGIVYSGLALVNPTPDVELTPSVIPLGAKARVKWTLGGRVDRISKLTIRLEGREEARYRRGTSTYTDRNVFQIIKLLETTSSFEIARGEATFDIPQDTMHSFEAGNNKIIWELKIRGEIARWPDMSADYPVQIVPMEMAMSEVQA